MRNQKQTILQFQGPKRTGEHFDRRQTQKQLLDIIQLKNDQLSVLNEINSRLSKELYNLQRKLGIDYINTINDLTHIDQLTIINEIPGLEYLRPLFSSYDQVIQSQKKIIAMLYGQLEQDQKKAETITRQNQHLLEQNTNKCRKILQIYHRGNPQDNLNVLYNSLRRQMQQQKGVLLREQNQHLLLAFKGLQHSYDEKQLELQQIKSSSQKYFNAYKQQSQQLKQALLSIDNLSKVKQFLQKTVNKLGQQNISLQNAKNDLQGIKTKLQAQLKSLRQQLLNNKKITRQDIQRQSLQLDSLKSQMDIVIKRQKQIFNKLMISQKQLQNFRDSHRAIKRQNQKLKNDFEQTLKMCQAYENKITVLTRKEQALKQASELSKQKLQQMILQRDKSLMKIQQLQKAFQTLNDRHRQQNIRVRNNYQKLLKQSNERSRNAQQERQNMESIFLQSQLSYKNQIQKLKRQNSLLHQENIKFSQNIQINTGSQIITRLRQYQSKNQSFSKIIAQKQKIIRDLQATLDQASHKKDSQLSNHARLLQKQRSLSSQYARDLTQQRSRVAILTTQKQCLQNQVRKLKKNIQYKNGLANQQFKLRMNQLQNQRDELKKKQRDTRQKAIAMLQKYDEAEQRLKSQYDKRVGQLEAQNQKLRRKITKIKQ